MWAGFKSEVDFVRALVSERLTAAAEEIFVLVKRTIVEYEEELCRFKEENQRKQQLLDSLLSPQLCIHRTEGVQRGCLSPEPNVSQEIPQTPQIKEEPEEQKLQHEEEQLPEFTAVCVKSEEQSSPLQQSPCSELTQGELCEEAEADLSLDPHGRIHKSEQQTNNSDDTDNDEDWEPPANSSTAQMETEADEEHDNQVQIKDTSPAANNQSHWSRVALVRNRYNRKLTIKKDNIYECSICKKKIATKHVLERHMRVHTGESPFTCPFCDKTFVNKSNLNCHMRIHTGERPFGCTVCNKAFIQKCQLDYHMRCHTGEIYRCSICMKTFTHKSSLNCHMRTHIGDRPYNCSECNKSFTRKGLLDNHMRTHTGERPYSCPVCNKTFTQKGNLECHMRTHTGERPYICSVCDKAFTHKRSLDNHKKTHTGELAHIDVVYSELKLKTVSKMCEKMDIVRALVSEKLTAAAEEIFALVKSTIVEYEEELCRFKEENKRKQELLESLLLSSQVHRAKGVQMGCLSPDHSVSQEIPQIKEEPEEQRLKQVEEQLPEFTAVCVKNEEQSSPLQQRQSPHSGQMGCLSPDHSVSQEIPQTPQIKEEPEEQGLKQEEEQLPEITAVCVKSEEQSSPLQQRQSPHSELIQGQHCGGAEADLSLDPHEHIHSESEQQTNNSSDTDNDEDWEPPVSSSTAQMETEAGGEHYNQVQIKDTSPAANNSTLFSNSKCEAESRATGAEWLLSGTDTAAGSHLSGTESASVQTSWFSVEPRVNQEIPPIKEEQEEQEEQRLKHEEEQLPEFTAVCVKNEEQSSPLQQRQSSYRELTQGEHSGGAEADLSLDPHGYIHKSEQQTNNSSGINNDEDWEPPANSSTAQMETEADGEHYSQVQIKDTSQAANNSDLFSNSKCCAESRATETKSHLSGPEAGTVDLVRALVSEKLTAAAEEIFALVKRTIEEYEEELCRSKEENQRKQQLLDSLMSPQPRSHTMKGVQTSYFSPDSSVIEEIPETPQIKKEPEKQGLKREEEQILEITAVCVKREEQSSPLQQKQSGCSDSTLGEHSGGAGVDLILDPHGRIHSENEQQTNNSSGINNDGDWEPPANSSTAQMEMEDDGEHDNQVQIKDTSPAANNSDLFNNSKYCAERRATGAEWLLSGTETAAGSYLSGEEMGRVLQRKSDGDPVDLVRALVSERLTAAAEEIFALVKRTIVEYEEELCRSKEENQRKQQLLDSLLSPQLRIHRTEGVQMGCFSPEHSVNLKIPQIKEEPEEQKIQQEEEQLPEFTAVCVKSDDQSSLLQQEQSFHRKLTQGEHCGGAEADLSLDPHEHDEEWEPPASRSLIETEADEDTSPVAHSLALFSNYKCGAERRTTGARSHLLGIETGTGRREKKHECTVCKKRFTTKINLKPPDLVFASRPNKSTEEEVGRSSLRTKTAQTPHVRKL
ncbi:hypothetical protein WMY93_016312 [Mugilogobius chulae]|uniref:C2H2-type domain-containing protein n=1 Tax=Mugilogobius chulae TaxID=88201 RepID=A0AAW0NT55_9GOBI